MAASQASSQWVQHHGVNAPVPSGTTIEADLFSGDRITFTTGAVQFDEDGNAEPQCGPTLYSAWKFHDGGPMPPKIRAYRIVGGDFAHSIRSRSMEVAK